jgi:hypothetical protein
MIHKALAIALLTLSALPAQGGLPSGTMVPGFDALL